MGDNPSVRIGAGEAFFRPGVRFSKVPRTFRTRKLFEALSGRVSRVSESVSQSARFSPEIFGDVFGKCNARNSASFQFPACDWFKNCAIDTAALSWVRHVRIKFKTLSMNRQQSFISSDLYSSATFSF